MEGHCLHRDLSPGPLQPLQTAFPLLMTLFELARNPEVQQALRQKTGRRLLCGLIVDTGQYNRGFLRNWHQFSTLGTHPFHHPAEDIV